MIRWRTSIDKGQTSKFILTSKFLLKAMTSEYKLSLDHKTNNELIDYKSCPRAEYIQPAKLLYKNYI